MKFLTALILFAGLLMSSSYAHAEAQFEHWLAPSVGSGWSPRLLLREQRPKNGDRSHPVLYIHGSSFPSALSIMYRFQGWSWADSLNAAGFDAFGLDFAGYGGSDRYPGMSGDENAPGEPRGRAVETSEQIARAVDFILHETGAKRVSIIAHSWGTMPAAIYTIGHPQLVDRIVMFGPVLRRDGPPQVQKTAWELVTIDQQFRRFTKDVPAGHARVLEPDFPEWAKAYLASDPGAEARSPPAVKTPAGPDADVLEARAGRFAYNPARLTRPVMLIRGEWDSSSTAKDADWFLHALPVGLERSYVTIPEATHLMHLETGRWKLYAATNAFLLGIQPPQYSATAPSTAVYAVVFEARPDPAHKSDYLRIASGLRPELLSAPGFIENERFASRTRPGMLLSLSLWSDEKALIRWRTNEDHHEAQAQGRGGVLSDYHLRVGEVVDGVGGPAAGPGDGRRDQTEVGAGKAVTLVDWTSGNDASLDAAARGFEPITREWFDHLSQPGRSIQLCSWASLYEARRYLTRIKPLVEHAHGRAYAIRVIRDYGLKDRREAPQYFPPARSTAGM